MPLNFNSINLSGCNYSLNKSINNTLKECEFYKNEM